MNRKWKLLNDNVGGFAFVPNISGGGNGEGYTHFSTGWNVDTLTHLTNSTWQSFSMTIDLTQTGGNALVVTPGGTDSQTNSPGLTEVFRNDTFFIGARNGNNAPLTGNIDNLKIEGVPIPEPGSAVLLLCGSAVLGRLRRRR